jgi:hypothetical protein
VTIELSSYRAASLPKELKEEKGEKREKKWVTVELSSYRAIELHLSLKS